MAQQKVKTTQTRYWKMERKKIIFAINESQTA